MPIKSVEDMSDADLEALSSGDVGGMSDGALEFIAREESAPVDSVPGRAPTAGNFGATAFSALSSILGERTGMDPAAALKQARAYLRGLTRQTSDAETAGEKMAESAGRVTPVAAAGLASAAASGGLSIPAAAGAMGLMTAGGEAAGQLAARAAGGEAPATSGEAGKEIVKTGLSAALTDLGLGAAVGMASKVAPNAAKFFDGVPSATAQRILKRFKANPKVAGAGIDTNGADTAAISAIRKIQDMAETERRMAGRAVDNALGGLQKTTKGKPTFDLSGTIARGKTALEDIRSGDPTVKEVLGAEITKIEAILKSMEASPTKDARSMVEVRRALDSLRDFKRGGLQDVQSEPGQRVLAEITDGLREEINRVAAAHNFKQLGIANENFVNVVNRHAEIRPYFATKDSTDRAIAGKFLALSGEYNKGGAFARLMEDASRHLPQAASQIDDVLDSIATRTLLERRSSPSSAVLNSLRIITGSSFWSWAMRGARALPPAGGIASGVAAGGRP